MGCSTRMAGALVLRLIEAGKLVEIDGELSNPRADFELENGAKNARNLAEWGARGGRKRAEIARAAKENNDIGQAGLKPRLQADKIREDKIESLALSPTTPRGPNTGLQDIVFEVCRIAEMTSPPSDAVDFVEAWIQSGIDPAETIYPTVTRLAETARKRRDRVVVFRYFDKAIVEAHRQAAEQAERERIATASIAASATGDFVSPISRIAAFFFPIWLGALPAILVASLVKVRVIRERSEDGTFRFARGNQSRIRLWGAIYLVLLCVLGGACARRLGISGPPRPPALTPVEAG